MKQSSDNFCEMCSESCVILVEIWPRPKKEFSNKRKLIWWEIDGNSHQRDQIDGKKTTTQRDEFPSPSVWFAEELDAKLQRFSARAESGSSLSCKFLGEFLGGVACLWKRVVVLSMLLSLQFLFFQFSSFLIVSPDEKDSCNKMLSNRWIWPTWPW